MFIWVCETCVQSGCRASSQSNQKQQRINSEQCLELFYRNKPEYCRRQGDSGAPDVLHLPEFLDVVHFPAQQTLSGLTGPIVCYSPFKKPPKEFCCIVCCEVFSAEHNLIPA